MFRKLLIGGALLVMGIEANASRCAETLETETALRLEAEPLPHTYDQWLSVIRYAPGRPGHINQDVQHYAFREANEFYPGWGAAGGIDFPEDVIRNDPDWGHVRNFFEGVNGNYLQISATTKKKLARGIEQLDLSRLTIAEVMDLKRAKFRSFLGGRPLMATNRAKKMTGSVKLYELNVKEQPEVFPSSALFKLSDENYQSFIAHIKSSRKRVVEIGSLSVKRDLAANRRPLALRYISKFLYDDLAKYSDDDIVFATAIAKKYRRYYESKWGFVEWNPDSRQPGEPIILTSTVKDLRARLLEFMKSL